MSDTPTDVLVRLALLEAQKDYTYCLDGDQPLLKRLADALTALQDRVKELEAEQAEIQGAKLPCDVLIAPATIIHAGVPLSTLHTALARRAGLDPRPTFSDLKELARSTNYWANDDQRPTEVTFANGRVVRIVDGALEVSFASTQENTNG